MQEAILIRIEPFHLMETLLDLRGSNRFATCLQIKGTGTMNSCITLCKAPNPSGTLLLVGAGT